MNDNKTKINRCSDSSDKIGKSRIKIQESIVVEGRDDSAAVLSAVDADIIITNGFHLRRPVVERMARALASNGLIILTDPDFAGEGIRRRIEKMLADRDIAEAHGEAADCTTSSEHRCSERQTHTLSHARPVACPDGRTQKEQGAHTIKHARLVAEDARRDGDIGIENAAPDVILEALLHAGASVIEPDFFRHVPEVTMRAQVQSCSEARGQENLICTETPYRFETQDSAETRQGRNDKDDDREKQPLTYADLLALGLTGEGSKERRIKIGRRLGIGYANAGQFLARLRRKGISADMLRRSVGCEENKES